MTSPHNEHRADGSDPATPVSEELLLQMFTVIARARALEDALAVHIRDHGFAGFRHPGKGQEGAGAGAVAAMEPDDYLFYQGRGATWPPAKGMGLEPIIGDLLGKATGSTGGKGAGVPHWADPALGIMGEGATLGSVYPVAAGAALSAQMRGSGQVALADFGDGTAARGTFHESLLRQSYVHPSPGKARTAHTTCRRSGLSPGSGSPSTTGRSTADRRFVPSSAFRKSSKTGRRRADGHHNGCERWE